MLRARLPERYTAGQIVAVARWFRENPAAVGVRKGGQEYNADQWFAWFRSKLDEKISHHDPRQPTGRKSQDEYQTELARLRYYIGTRVIIRWVAPCLGPHVKAALADRFPD